MTRVSSYGVPTCLGGYLIIAIQTMREGNEMESIGTGGIAWI